jgi:hypothetical protein
MTLGYGISEAANTTSHRFVMGASTTLFFVVYGAALILCAWGMNSLRSWARGPVLFSQLAWLGLAWNFRTGGTWPISVILAVPAVLVLVALLQPASLDALNRHEQP